MNADVENSGATLVYLSPGVNLQLAPTAHAYQYLQVPVYQRVNGYQLEPRYTVTSGSLHDVRRCAPAAMVARARRSGVTVASRIA